MLIPRVAQQLHDQLRTARVIGGSRRKTDQGLGEGICAIAASWQRRGWQLGIVLALGLSGAIAFSRDRALAQITPDLTLGSETSRVIGGFVIKGIPSDLIRGGAIRGTNLFHSFAEFNVNSGQRVFFTNPVGIENILSRVTGGSSSNIFGTLGVLGNANLFLINPNGIIFGLGARLDLGGSFVATTANGIEFGNQGIFSASPANVIPPTLTINPSALLFNQLANQATGSIAVTNGAVLSVGAPRNPRSLLLVGGNVLVESGILQGRDGSQIQVAGFTGTGNVGLSVALNNVRLGFPDNGVAGANVLFTDEASINVSSSTSNAGNILLTGGTLYLTGGTQLRTITYGVGNAGNVFLQAFDNVVIDGGSQILSQVAPGVSANAGNIVVIATQGSVFLNNSRLSTTNFGSGLAGDISVSAGAQVSFSNSGIFSRGNLGRIFIGESEQYSSLSPQIITINNSTLNASVPPDFSGNAGGIFLNAGSIFLTDSEVDSNNFASGIAGDMIIRGRDLVYLVNSQITSKSENANTSDFSSITIDATQGSVLLSNSTLSTTNSGSGYAGDISISARDQVSILNQSSITSQGYVGRILFEATQGSFLLADSTLSTTNFASSLAGDISISARDQVSILNSNIFSQGYWGRIFIGKSDEYASFSPEIIRIDNSNLLTNSLNSERLAGDVSLDAINTVLISSSDISSTASGDANAGSISVQANGLVSLNRSEVSTNNTGSGIAGEISIRSRDQVSVVNSEITSKSQNDNISSFSSIQIAALQGSVLLSNSTLSTSNFGSGYAGDIGISASDQVSIENNSSIFSRGNLGFILIGRSRYASFSPRIVTIDNSTLNTNNSSFEGAGSIDAGGISIQANDVVALTNGTEVTSSTLRTGDAGAVLVRTNGGFVLLNNSNIFSTVERGGVGDGGNITIETGSLYLRNGSQLQTLVRGISDEGTPAGQGNAGRITVIADDTVTVSGRNSDGFPSAIFSNVQFGTQENSRGGDVTITARSLYINNGGRVSVDNTGLGQAGNIDITVRDDLFLENQAFLRATTNFGQGGNINLTIGDFLVLTRNSGISTEAGRALGAGDGGNIDINIGNPRARAIFAAPSNDSNIQANAFLGSGGNIRVNVGHLYDIDRRLLDPSTNDINASSTYGRQGQVNINELEIDPHAGLNNLPVETVDSSSLIAQNCPARGRGSAQEENKFIVTGRGGLPPNPNDTLQAESVVTNWVTIDPQVENRTGNVTSGNPIPDTPAQTSVLKPPALVEAQGWIIGQKGEIILTAQPSKVTPHNPSLLPTAICNGS